MKKTITLLAVMLSAISLAQTLAPTIYTTEAAFKAAIKTDYSLNEFASCVKATYYPSIVQNTGTYKYTITEVAKTPKLYGLAGAFATSFNNDSILITNNGAAVYAFGGYFYNTDTNGALKAGNIKVRVGTYTYIITAATTTKFVGFVFPEAITSVYIAYPTAQTNLPYWYASMDHLYWGTATNISTSINETDVQTVSVYPNPTSDFIKLSSTENIQTVSIKNLSGTLVWRGSASQFPINVSTFSKGIYLVNIVSAVGAKTEKVIIK